MCVCVRGREREERSSLNCNKEGRQKKTDILWCSSFSLRNSSFCVDVLQLSSSITTFFSEYFFWNHSTCNFCNTCLNTCKLMKQFFHASWASSSQLNKPFHQISMINLMVSNHWLISKYLEKSQQKFLIQLSEQISKHLSSISNSNLRSDALHEEDVPWKRVNSATLDIN